MTQPQSAFRRAPRPTMLWVILAVVTLVGLGLAYLLFRIGAAIITAFDKAAESSMPVPDMSGGLPALLTAIGGAVAVLWPVIRDLLQGRSRERVEEIRAGQRDRPFPSPTPSEPSPTGGLVNNEAIDP